jgi:hypothetical protein
MFVPSHVNLKVKKNISKKIILYYFSQLGQRAVLKFAKYTGATAIGKNK